FYTKKTNYKTLDIRYRNNVRSYVKVIPAVDGVPALSQEDFDKYPDTRLEKMLGWSQYSNLTADYNTIMMHYQMVRDLKGDPAKGGNWDITAYDYKPGEVKHGIALFPLEDPNMETMRILVDGLTNEHYFNHATFDNFYQQLQDPNYAMYNPPESWPHTLRRVLDLRFKRTANTGFEMGNTTFDFISQHWDKVWDPLADMQILSDMPKPEMMDGFYPDAAKHPLWHVQWKITNNTNQVQLIRFDKMYYNVKINLDLSGTNLKHEGTIPVWVRVVDDGNMSIFKEKYLKEHPELTGSADDRTYYDRYHFYPEKNDELDKQPREFRDLIELQPTTPETRGQETPQTTRSSVSVFDAQDIDWDNVFLQVTIALSRDIKNPKETIGSVMRNFPNPKDAKGALLAKELAEAGRLSYNPKFTFAGMNGGDPQKDIDDVKKLVYDAVVKAVTDGASASTAGTKCINLSLATTQLGPKEPDQFEAFKNADPLGQYIGAGLETNTFFLTKRTPVDLHDVLNERDKPDASLGGETGP
ncbi:MAG: hypothetical protein ACREJ2_14025, partial [Planctomycetota bacterium]